MDLHLDGVSFASGAVVDVDDKLFCREHSACFLCYGIDFAYIRLRTNNYELQNPELDVSSLESRMKKHDDCISRFACNETGFTKDNNANQLKT